MVLKKKKPPVKFVRSFNPFRKLYERFRVWRENSKIAKLLKSNKKEERILGINAISNDHYAIKEFILNSPYHDTKEYALNIRKYDIDLLMYFAEWGSQDKSLYNLAIKLLSENVKLIIKRKVINERALSLIAKLSEDINARKIAIAHISNKYRLDELKYICNNPEIKQLIDRRIKELSKS